MTQYITVKAPREIFNVKEFNDGLAAVVRAAADEAEAYFKSSVQHFSNPPSVYKKVSKRKAVIGINDKNYARLSNGSDTHQVGVRYTSGWRGW